MDDLTAQDGLRYPPIPVASSAVVAFPSPTASSPVVESTRWGSDEYIILAITVVFVGVTVPFVVITAGLLATVLSAVSTVIELLTGSGPLLITLLILAGLVSLVSRIPNRKSSRPVPEPHRHGNATGSTPTPDPVHDELTQRWLDKMRDPQSRQARGSLEDPVRDGNGAVIAYSGAKCANGWLLVANGDPNERRARRAMERRYGIPLLRGTARLNDHGASLREVADYVERKFR